VPTVIWQGIYGEFDVNQEWSNIWLSSRKRSCDPKNGTGFTAARDHGTSQRSRCSATPGWNAITNLVAKPLHFFELNHIPTSCPYHYFGCWTYIYISLYRSNIFGIFPCITGFSRVSHWVGCTKEEFSSSLYQQTLSWPWRCRQPYVRSWCDYLHDVVPQEGILIHFSFLCSCCSVWIPVFFA
jgi:hypothetical protein